MTNKVLPPGFSRGINDALIVASNLMHLKAGALLGFALTLFGFVLSQKSENGAGILHYCGLALLFASACASGAVIYPKKSVRRRGFIFWGDIATYGSAPAYVQSLEGLDASGVDQEYAYTNHRLSTLLDAKYGLLRWAVGLLLAGAGVSALSRIL
jgi:hypothetical protein